MHPPAFAFVRAALIGLMPTRVLEIGSLDVNSTAQGLDVRRLVPVADYTGIDERAGPGVDVVVGARDYDGAGMFDLVISTEAAEHTPRPEDIVQCAWRALRPGGVFVLTAAGPGRAPHGCDGGALPAHEWYANITPDALATWLQSWQDVQIVVGGGDIYATATKSA